MCGASCKHVLRYGFFFLNQSNYTEIFKLFSNLLTDRNERLCFYVKRHLMSCMVNFVYELPKDLRLRILGKLEIIRKHQNCMGTHPSGQSSDLQKSIFANSSQNLCKSSYQSFLVLSKFAWFFHFLPNVFSRIVNELCFFKVCTMRISIFQ